MGDVTVDEVERLLDLADHRSTPASIRGHLPSLRAQAVRSPPRASERFASLAAPVLKALPTVEPSRTLYRAQTLGTFLAHCTAPEFREVDVETARRHLERIADPDAWLAAALERGRVVFPWDHSWLVEAGTKIRTATGTELVSLLELGTQRPPLVLCVLPLRRLLRAGVRIRTPTAADAALGGHDYWSGADVPAGPEFVDLNVTGEAVEEVLWRP